jgi:hypothetical protein
VSAFRRVVIEGAEMETEIRDELGAQVFVADDDEEAERQTIVRERPVDPNRLERLRALLNRVEAGD